MTAAPAYAWEYELLLATVQRVLADREADYPTRVAAGKMSQDDADRGVRVMRAIVADWQRVIDLRAGREPQPIDATATDVEKRQALTYVDTRERKLLDRAVASLRPMLDDIGALAPVDSGDTSREALRTVWQQKWKDWPHREIGLFLTAERRTWLTEALLWHAERWPLAMLYAEIQAGLIARDRASEAA